MVPDHGCAVSWQRHPAGKLGSLISDVPAIAGMLSVAVTFHALLGWVHFGLSSAKQATGTAKKGKEGVGSADAHVRAPLSEEERAKNRTKSSVRSKVEHVFQVMKLKFGFVKLRYRGLKKNAHQLFVICGLVNLFLSRQKLLPASA